MIAGDTLAASYDLTLHIERYHDDSPWASYPMSFSLVSACHSTVWAPGESEGRALVSPANRVAFERVFTEMLAGRYKVRTVLLNPQDRLLRLIAATPGAVKASLDGTLIFEDMNETNFIPAYHRSAPSKLADVNLPKGRHVLEIEVDKGLEELELYILPVANGTPKTPGANYYLSDILFIPEDYT